MIDGLSLRRLIHWSLLTLFAGITIFMRILPVDLRPGAWPGPDLVLLLCFAWVMRRPDFVPLLLAGLLLLTADFIYMHPPGLWAALGVLAIEFLRPNRIDESETPFMFEWFEVALVLGFMILANRFILGLFAVPQHSILLEFIFYMMNLASYPIIVIMSVRVLGVRRPISAAELRR